jgi:hypothetical protein
VEIFYYNKNIFHTKQMTTRTQEKEQIHVPQMKEKEVEAFSLEKHGHIYGEAVVSSRVYLVTMILLFITGLIVGIVKAEQANGTSNEVKTGIFFQWFAVIFVTGSAFLAAMGHLTPHVREGFAKSIGWNSNSFQLEVGFAYLAVGIMMLVSHTNFNLQSQYSVALVWSIFTLLAGSNHVYEFFQGNNSESTITSIWWDFVPSMILIVTGGIGIS